MKKSLVTAGALAAAGWSALASAAVLEPSSSKGIDWRGAAKKDVAAAYELYVANHPGMHDPANPEFPAQLKRALVTATQYAGKATDEVGYRTSLAAFSSQLADGHARLVPKQSPEAAAEFLWPGFVAAWRGNGLRVHKVGSGFPLAVGTKVTSCDGMPIRQLAKEKLFPLNFLGEAEGEWWEWTPHLFMPSTTLAATAPKKCSFVEPSGRKRTLALDWRTAPPVAGDWINAATVGQTTSIGMSEPLPRIFLIGLPTFAPGPEGVKAYNLLFDQVKQRHEQLSSARAVVLDLRGNGGGSSSWSRKLAGLLWGDEVVEAAMERYAAEQSVWWRASPGTVTYLREMEPRLRSTGKIEIADYVAQITRGTESALHKKEHFFKEDSEADAGNLPANPSSAFKTPVYVITSGRCASACLDALDTFSRFANVKLIGAPTSADTTYMDVRRQDLPSGHGVAIIPMKVLAGRPRRSGEFYRPNIPVTDLDWSTATFLKNIERDLRR